MAGDTARTRVFMITLQRCLRKQEAVTSHSIADLANTTERTARDCLKALEGIGFLRRERLDDGTVRYVPSVEIVSN